MVLVPRPLPLARLRALLRIHPVVAVLGPRQCGKSTLAAEYLAGRPHVRFDLESHADLARLEAAPEDDLGALQAGRRTICIDEVQRMPALFPLLRSLVDRPGRRASYLLLGSASPALVSQASETLAGRIGFLDMGGFLAAEAAAAAPSLQWRRDRLWLRGGFPRSYLARTDAESAEWRLAFIRTFLERDVPALGLRIPAASLRRFWTMLAHVHGGRLNASDLAASMGVSPPTAARYLEVLSGMYVVRCLPPYYANVGKRLVKAPKVYIRDSGLLHALLGVWSIDALRSHPKAGASWEGWVIEQVIEALSLLDPGLEAYYWRTHAGAEVDLLLRLGGALVPVEIKISGAPEATRGLRVAMEDLGLRRAFVIHGGRDRFPLGGGVTAIPASLLEDPAALLSTLRGGSGERGGGRGRRKRPRR